MRLSLFLVLGAPFVGSYLGVLATRLPAAESPVFGRSRCDACHRTLSPIELIPIASWLWLRRRCRYCGTRLGVFYPAIELGAAALALWAAAVTSGAALVASCVFGWTLLALAVIDWRSSLLPDPLDFILLVTGFIAAHFIDPASISDRAIGAGAGFASFTALAWVYRHLRGREGLGFGDAKLVSDLGAWLGWQGLPSAVLAAATLALLIVLVRGLLGAKLTLSDRVPFGSYLAAGGWLVWLFGPLTVQ